MSGRPKEDQSPQAELSGQDGDGEEGKGLASWGQWSRPQEGGPLHVGKVWVSAPPRPPS